jgi:hypothetical protein
MVSWTGARGRLCSTSGPVLVCRDVADPKVELVGLPVGFERFHRRRFLNYQFNRAHALGWADRRELRDAAARTRSPQECVAVFEDLSAQAATEGRLRHAVGYLRLAEFFTPPRSAAKVERYRRFRALFDAALTGGGLIRHAIPYAGASLPAYWLPAAGQRRSGGVVLIHGGFDSLIEEFYPIWQRIAVAGFDVVAFEGPGQGGARALGGLTFDHDWERPVGAVLDYFGVASVGLVGISMGGYLGIARCGAGTAYRSCGRVATRFRLALPVTGGYARPGPDDAASQTADALECADPRAIDTDSAADRGPDPLPG